MSLPFSRNLAFLNSEAYGSEMPMDHQAGVGFVLLCAAFEVEEQVPDRYFPSTNQFTKAPGRASPRSF